MILVGMLILQKINKLKKLEIAAIWLFIPSLIHDIAIGLSNLKIIELTKNIEMHSSFIVGKTLLIPVIILMFINASVGRPSVTIKIMISLFSAAILLFVEYSFEWAGVITHKNVSLWSSYLFWLLTILLLLGLRQFFNILLQRRSKHIV
ncbi:hypothetical protein JOC86_004060 [Bacillus pakistanensis]|uniref:Uncharacterized protein n=2 Tax=Rossellomorea pakistanensis TaxID=992288 RepID=A0ABS2NI16_9BACI|nr:hypothetical protein [Bacillus pakistanensis]